MANGNLESSTCICHGHAPTGTSSRPPRKCIEPDPDYRQWSGWTHSDTLESWTCGTRASVLDAVPCISDRVRAPNRTRSVEYDGSQHPDLHDELRDFEDGDPRGWGWLRLGRVKPAFAIVAGEWWNLAFSCTGADCIRVQQSSRDLPPSRAMNSDPRLTKC
jgi:hypothetical protein